MKLKVRRDEEQSSSFWKFSDFLLNCGDFETWNYCFSVMYETSLEKNK